MYKETKEIKNKRDLLKNIFNNSFNEINEEVKENLNIKSIEHLK